MHTRLHQQNQRTRQIILAYLQRRCGGRALKTSEGPTIVNCIRKVRLPNDGLATDDEMEGAYDPWRYPANWIVETFAPEGPKLYQVLIMTR